MRHLPLTQLFQGDRAPGHPVALAPAAAGDGAAAPVPRTQAEFAAAAAWVAAHARRTGGDRWVLACEQAWDFAAGLFGLLLAERTVILPPNFLPRTLAALAAPEAVLAGLPGPEALRGQGDPGRMPIRGGRLEFWTSGSTGEPKGVAKDLAQLDAEVAMLERMFGHLLTAGPVAGTVPHHHIYGCLFRILWPLASGRPFLCEPCGEPGALRRALAQPLAATLVASPAHLSRLPALVDLGALPVPPAVVFSSGGPLRGADALVWNRWVPGGVVEIYGSTESGGIAWRSQDPAPESGLWTPLDDVALSFEDPALVVASLRAGAAPLRMEDAAEPAGGGRFRLLGRLDRTVKLEEKRVSLPELERALETHPWVERAAVLVLAGVRPVLGAAVVLRPGAPAGRGPLVRALRAHLAPGFDGLALPRRWRFPRELPFDARGKLTPEALARLFQPAAGRWPEPAGARPLP